MTHPYRQPPPSEPRIERDNGNLWLRAPGGGPQLCPICPTRQLLEIEEELVKGFPSLMLCPKCRRVSISYEDSAEFRTAAALERIAAALEKGG